MRWLGSFRPALGCKARELPCASVSDTLPSGLRLAAVIKGVRTLCYSVSFFSANAWSFSSLGNEKHLEEGAKGGEDPMDVGSLSKTHDFN